MKLMETNSVNVVGMKTVLKDRRIGVERVLTMNRWTK